MQKRNAKNPAHSPLRPRTHYPHKRDTAIGNLNLHGPTTHRATRTPACNGFVHHVPFGAPPVMNTQTERIWVGIWDRPVPGKAHAFLKHPGQVARARVVCVSPAPSSPASSLLSVLRKPIHQTVKENSAWTEISRKTVNIFSTHQFRDCTYIIAPSSSFGRTQML